MRPLSQSIVGIRPTVNNFELGIGLMGSRLPVNVTATTDDVNAAGEGRHPVAARLSHSVLRPTKGVVFHGVGFSIGPANHVHPSVENGPLSGSSPLPYTGSKKRILGRQPRFFTQ